MNREQRRANNPEMTAYQEGFNEGFERAAPRITQVIYCAILNALLSDRRKDKEITRFLKMVDEQVMQLSNDPSMVEVLWEQIGRMLERRKLS